MSGSDRPGRITTVLAVLSIVLLAALYPFHFYVTRIVDVNLSYGDLVIGVAGVLWLFGVVGVRRLPRFTYPVAGFVAVALVSTGVALASGAAYVVPEHSAAELVKLLGAIAWFVGVFALVARDAIRRTQLLAFASIVVATVFAVQTAHQGLVVGELRPSGPFENPNIFANYLVLNGFLAAFLAGSLQSRRPLVATLVSLSIPALCAGLVVTVSRGSLLGAVAGALAVPILHPKPKLRSLAHPAFLLPVGMTAAAGAYVIRTDQWIRDRVLESTEPDGQNVATRLDRWSYGFEGFVEHPLIGVGYGQSQNYVQAAGFDNPFPRLHNTHLTVATETGVLGVLLLYLLLALVVIQSVRLARDHEPAYAFLGCFVVAIAAEGLVTDVLTFRSLWLVTGVVAALSWYHRGEALALRDVPEDVSAAGDSLRSSIPRIWPS